MYRWRPRSADEIPDYAEKVQATIDSYWHVRRSQAERSREAGVVDTGLRAEVTGGKHLNALQLLVVDVIVDAGMPAGKLQVKTRPVPGYFDNRTDEALGQAIDVSKAVERGIVDSPLRPWLGYVMLIEDNEAWNRTSKPRKPVWPADPVFDESSPADRAAIFFDRTDRERLLDAACVMLANRTTGGVTYKRESLSLQSFAAALFGRCLQFRVTNSDIDWTNEPLRWQCGFGIGHPRATTRPLDGDCATTCCTIALSVKAAQRSHVPQTSRRQPVGVIGNPIAQERRVRVGRSSSWRTDSIRADGSPSLHESAWRTRS